VTLIVHHRDRDRFNRDRPSRIWAVTVETVTVTVETVTVTVMDDHGDGRSKRSGTIWNEVKRSGKK
jgi:hypothetical protein